VYFEREAAWEYGYNLIFPELNPHPNTAYVISKYSIAIELPEIYRGHGKSDITTASGSQIRDLLS